METKLPANWYGPVLDRYNGSTDPDEHIDIYIMQISLYTSDTISFA